MLVCRVTLGYSCRTLGARPPHRVLHDADFEGRPVFGGTVKKLNTCPLMPAAHAFEYQSLVAELGPIIVRYREFIIYHQEAVPMYLMAYHRV